VLLTSVVCVLVAETLARGLARLRGSEAEMRFLVQHTTDLVTRIGIDGVIRYVSPSVQSVLGWRTEQVVGRRVSDFAHPDDPQPYELALVHPGKTVTVVRRLRKASGEWAWLETVAKQVTAPDGSAEVLTSARDVTRWREHEERLAHEATHDVLTGLPNRALLDRRLEQATLTRTSDPVLVAFVDLDGFKAINDRYGHHVGDQLLVEAGRRLSGMTREQDTVARYGGDEFVLVVQGLRDDAARDALVHRVEADLSRPYLIDELELHVGASVGVTVAPPGARSGDVLADADRRMYDVKASRRADVPAPRAAR
jgi:diguanylate cyclase (GGDEF)-like protein/PAS domain S-box-containing protein